MKKRASWPLLRFSAAMLMAAALGFALLPGCVTRDPAAAPDTAENAARAAVLSPAAPVPGVTPETVPPDAAPAYRLVATSRAAVELCDRLGLALVGRPALTGLPARYADAAETGAPMAPDLEILRLLEPTEIIGPDTLEGDLGPGYENAGLPATFLNLRSVAGLCESAAYLGEKYGPADRAQAMAAEYETALADLAAARGDRDGPTVLILMGLPGAYVSCTPHSYAGSLVEMGGGVNVVTDPTESFVSWNTEALLALDPDIILRTAHALPDQVAEMFAKEFSENEIWRHFRAVQEGRVYDLDSEVFGMSANFRWPEAVTRMQALFYGAEAP
ncbi:MAG: ABC transporter substrate-binding protein [Oscillospiraceae bacterium]|jgi:iron complex transport system substrate-binding protein|nr:ABC transporter substrate-binding protein [Oscillospiraceae bacterium]